MIADRLCSFLNLRFIYVTHGKVRKLRLELVWLEVSLKSLD